MKQISSLLDICSEIKFKDMQRIVSYENTNVHDQNIYYPGPLGRII